ncbi:hypothetical protein AYI68_g4099 [Smittium mucronatum]|uniref:Uncharacterized protein n=1 Tax=Smittium mucronatum TaxID=133383 RepID=A0A1R0GY08_9FUNG|nr:hypothetical protein AYI68_g4099 [Smittium mucronatum]
MAEYMNTGSSPYDGARYFVKGTILLGRIAHFTNTRWQNKTYDQKTISLKFICLIKEIISLSSIVDTMFPGDHLYNIDFSKNYLSDSVSVRRSEARSYLFLLSHLLKGLTIQLYISELYRSKKHSIHPGRIRSAKRKAIASAISLVEASKMEFKFKPKPFWNKALSLWTISCSLILLNLRFVEDYDLVGSPKQYFESYLNAIVENSDSGITNFLVRDHIMYLYSLKDKKSIDNNFSRFYVSKMGPYSISSNDYLPWLVPRYSSFIRFRCCISANYSTLDVTEYL